MFPGISATVGYGTKCITHVVTVPIPTAVSQNQHAEAHCLTPALTTLDQDQAAAGQQLPGNTGPRAASQGSSCTLFSSSRQRPSWPRLPKSTMMQTCIRSLLKTAFVFGYSASTTCMLAICRGQETVSVPLELDLQTVVGHQK